MGTETRPTWLTGACPPWCAREHREEDHPEDRRHQSVATLLTLPMAADPIPAGATRPIDVAAYLDQPVTEDRCWLRLESVDSRRVRLALTLGSAAELGRALAAAVALAAGDGPAVSA